MVHFKKTYLCERRLRLVSVFKRKKNEKNEKKWNNNERGQQRGHRLWPCSGRVRHRTGHVRWLPAAMLLATFLATFVAVRLPSGHASATFNVARTWPTTWPSTLATLQRGQGVHFPGHVPATFVATFRPRSWPSPATFVATFKLDFWSFLTCFWEVFKIEQIRLVYAFGTTQKTSKIGF